MAKKEEKTNVMRTLDQKKIAYIAPRLRPADGPIDGVSVARTLGQDPALRVQDPGDPGGQRRLLRFRHPGGGEPGPEKGRPGGGGEVRGHAAPEGAAAADGLRPRRVQSRGHEKVRSPRCSTETAADLPTIMVSAGRIGRQVQCDPKDLLALLGAKTADIIVE